MFSTYLSLCQGAADLKLTALNHASRVLGGKGVMYLEGAKGYIQVYGLPGWKRGRSYFSLHPGEL